MTIAPESLQRAQKTSGARERGALIAGGGGDPIACGGRQQARRGQRKVCGTGDDQMTIRIATRVTTGGVRK